MSKYLLRFAAVASSFLAGYLLNAPRDRPAAGPDGYPTRVELTLPATDATPPFHTVVDVVGALEGDRVTSIGLRNPTTPSSRIVLVYANRRYSLVGHPAD